MTLVSESTRSFAVTAPLPDHVQLEVTSACNLRCQMCLVRYRPPVNKLAGAMTMDVFRRLVDSTPALRKLTLQGLGEPLLSPHLLDMVAYAKQHGIAVGFNSNGTLLHRAVADRLVDLQLDWLHVSVDGATAATYEGIRDGSDFAKVERNLLGLAAAKSAGGGALPWVQVVFVAMRRNLAELPDLVELVADWGVDELRVQNLSHSFDDTDPSGSYGEIREFAAAEALWNGDDADVTATVFAAARERAGARGVALRLPGIDLDAARRPAGPGCTWPWDGVYVTSAGIVQPCCMVMGDDRVALGDLNTTDFPEIWNGPAYQEFRSGLLTGPAPDVCLGCSMYRGVF
ncbi:MAG TPA: radical SAM protein [Mycobacteriales bacterium]|nr:radical SAM protein [Mycobacteriales bacterium]